MDRSQIEQLKEKKKKLEEKLKKVKKQRRKMIRQGTTESQKAALFAGELARERELERIIEKINKYHGKQGFINQ